MARTHSSLIDKDLTTIWHPFTQMKTASPPIPIVRAKGAFLFSEEGHAYLDGISSWWVNLHGHAHPYIAEKIKTQVDILEQVIFAGFTHAPAVDLACRLLPLLPGTMSKIFYSDNGSTAVEVAIKIALQYWYNQNIPKTKVICMKRSYHGDTFGAMSAAGKNGFNRPFWKQLFDVMSIETPLPGYEERSLAELISFIETGDAACFIFEPLVLGAGGMILYSIEGLNQLLACCRKHNVLIIADEVMTGFGRTGSLFACDQISEAPDLICLSKGLTGGFLPLGVTACSEEIFQAFSDSAFLHGHSYTANPLACVSALASLDLLLEKSSSLKREMIAKSHAAFCRKWRSHHKLKRCESLGTLLALEYKGGELRDRLYHFFLSKEVLLRPLGNVVYLLPPYCIQPEELTYIYDQIILTLEGTVL